MALIEYPNWSQNLEGVSEILEDGQSIMLAGEDPVCWTC